MMEITRYILLVVFSICCILLVFSHTPKKRCELFSASDHPRIRDVFLFVIIVLLIIAAVIKPASMADYGSYVRLFYGESNNERMEPFISIVIYFINKIGGNYFIMFFIFALISISMRVFLISKFSPLIWGGMAVYLSNIYILHDLIQIRAAVASALLIIVIYFSYTRNLKCFILAYLIALFCHYSSIVYAIIWFITPHKNPLKYFFFVVISYLIYFSQINLASLIQYIPFLSISSLITDYANRDAFENNALNLIQLFRLAIAFFFFLKINNKQNEYPWFIYFLKVYILGLCFLPMFSSISGVSLRLMELFTSCEVIVIPVGFFISFRRKFLSKLAILGYSIVVFSIFYSSANYWDVILQ